MLEEIKSRRSIRKYIANKPVEDKKITELIESARLAPSGSNTQPWHFIVVKSDLTRKKLAEASHNQPWMLSAPVFIVCVADIRSRTDEKIELNLDENSPEARSRKKLQDIVHYETW